MQTEELTDVVVLHGSVTFQMEAADAAVSDLPRHLLQLLQPLLQLPPLM